MIQVERDPMEMRTIVRLRNSIGGWSTVLDERGRPADYEADPVTERPRFRSFEEARNFFDRMDERFAQWWSE